MKIGIYIGDYKPEEGGGYTYERELLNALSLVKSRHEFYIFYMGIAPPLVNTSLTCIPVSENKSLIHRIYRKTNRIAVKIGSLVREKKYKKTSSLSKAVLKNKIQLMWFVAPYFDDIGIPFIFPVWDLAHRITPFFPEVNTIEITWEGREHFFRSIMPKASYIITGTEAGKKEISQFYQVPLNRIKIVPLPTPSFIANYCSDTNTASQDFNISSPYLFYPAQFWSHKNHICILLALKILKEKYNINFSVVFTGSDKGNLKYIQQQTNELGLSDKVHFLGFVSTADLVGLYKKAFALVFPSFFGPDNLPPLEAFAIGCPVIAHRVSGATEQLGDAALLIDASKEGELANAVKLLVEKPEIRMELITKGLQKSYKYNSKDYVEDVLNIIEEFEPYRRCWDI